MEIKNVWSEMASHISIRSTDQKKPLETPQFPDTGITDSTYSLS